MGRPRNVLIFLLCIAPLSLAGPPVTPTFVDRSGRSGISGDFNFKYGGPVIADLDGDGWDDIILSEHDLGPLRVYLRKTGHSFDLEYQYPIRTPDWHGIAVYDFDGNGRQDLILAEGGAFGTKPSSPLLLSYTNSDSAFDILPRSSFGLDQYTGRLRSVRFMDLDLDGDQDLLLTARTLNDRKSGGPLGELVFYENDGTESWNVYDETSLFNSKCSASVLVTDIDNDQILDLICGERSDLTVLRGTGMFPTPFQDVTKKWLRRVERPTEKRFIDYMTELDYNNDGRMDVYVTCGLNYTLLPCDDTLLRNTGTGFVDVSTAAGLPRGGLHQEPAVGDFNLDGFVDILIPSYGTRAGSARNVLMVNQGDGTFEVVTLHGANENPSLGLRGAGAGSILMGRSGRLDVVMGYEGPGPGGPWRFYKNRTPIGRSKFLSLKVLEKPSRGLSARGALVTIVVGGNTMTRRVGNDGGEGQSFSGRVHFGLGTVSIVDSVRISYVGGVVRTTTNVTAGFRSLPTGL